MPINRRHLLRAGILSGVAAGGGLGLLYARYRLDDGDARRKFGAGPDEPVLNAWLRIGTDGRIVCGVHRAEMGQGVTTSLPMLLAEELDADWRHVRYEFTPVDKDYFNFGILLRGEPLGPVEGRFWARTATGLIRAAFHQLGMGLTISSSSTVDAWDTLRRAGAEARAMLVAAAADRWSVPAARLTTAASVVTDPVTGRTATYGELAEAAAVRRPPGNVALKSPASFRLLGRSLPRLDVPAKVTGEARFAIDTVLPGMLFGVVSHAPRVGGRIGRVDDRAARATPGVIDVLRLGDRAVAVLAGDTWTARRGAAGLALEPHADDRVQPDTAVTTAAYRQGPGRARRVRLPGPRRPAGGAGAGTAPGDLRAAIPRPCLPGAHELHRPLRARGYPPPHGLGPHPGRQHRPRRGREGGRVAAGAGGDPHDADGGRLRPPGGDGLRGGGSAGGGGDAGPAREADLDAGGGHPPRHVPAGRRRPGAGRAGCPRAPRRARLPPGLGVGGGQQLRPHPHGAGWRGGKGPERAGGRPRAPVHGAGVAHGLRAPGGWHPDRLLAQRLPFDQPVPAGELHG